MGIDLVCTYNFHPRDGSTYNVCVILIDQNNVKLTISMKIGKIRSLYIGQGAAGLIPEQISDGYDKIFFPRKI